jgi:cytidylate kinase
MTSTRLPIVTIDGPAGAGKSTLAARLARRFGLLNLETGAMYRAFALKAVEANVNPDDQFALKHLAADTTIHLEPNSTGNIVYLDGSDVTSQLRNAEITEAASRVSVHPAIRAWMVSLQRHLGEQGGVVMEGRDIGTAVFPDAEVKIFLDAAPETRGLRRYQQVEAASEVQPESVIREMKERDARDRNRAQSPLRAATDAIVIDSTNMTLDEVVAQAESIIAERLSARPLPASL